MSQDTFPLQNIENAAKIQTQLQLSNVNQFSLEDRLRIIQAYDSNPANEKISLMFNCNWTDVEKIINERDFIMRLHRNTLNANCNEARERKMHFLRECLYVYIQRAQIYTATANRLNERLIRSIATDFSQILQIEDFSPNHTWISQFKQAFNLKTFRTPIDFDLTPSTMSLDLNEIIMYCLTQSNQPTVQSIIQQIVQPIILSTVQPVQQNNNSELKARNQFATPKRKLSIYNLRYTKIYHKIILLEKCLYEYIRRAQYHEQKTFDDETLKQVAFDFDYMLKIPIFRPNSTWVRGFKDRYRVNQVPGLETIGINQIPEKSLKLEHIINDVSKAENKKHLVPRKRRRPRRIVQKTSTPTSSLVDEKYYRNGENRESTENIKNEESDESDEIGEIDEIQRTPCTSKNRKRRGYDFRFIPEELHCSIEIIEEEQDVKPDLVELEENLIFQTPPTKMKKIASTDMKSIENAQQTQFEEKPRTSNQEQKPIRNCEEALTLVKALSDFSILKKSYKCVSALMQMEAILTVYQHFQYATRGKH